MSSSFLAGMDMAGGPPTLKKTPLLSSSATQQKVTAIPKTYVFELELGESNHHTYPEFSWADLVKDVKDKELEEKRKRQGGSLLDPYASDDEDNLKELAARLEEKYGGQSIKPSKKKKQKLDDCIDRAAGYDESDSFIDNTDAYDEKLPKELQPACGGFYINSGQLDLKEVQVSEDDEDDGSDDDRGKTIVKPKSLKPTITAQKEKANKITKMGPNSSTHPKSGDGIIKKRKTSQDTPVSRPKPAGQAQQKAKPNNLMNTAAIVNNEVLNRKRPRQISSSSNSSSESSSTSSSEDSSTSTESVEENEQKPKPKVKDRSIDPDIIVLNAPLPSKTSQQKHKKPPPPGPISTDIIIKPTTLVPRKPRVKNVPLNPNLKRTDVPGSLPINNTSPLPTPPPATITRKVLNSKDLVKPKSDSQGSKLSKINNAPSSKPVLILSQNSPSSIASSPSLLGGNKTSVIKVPTPKSSTFNSSSTSSSGMVTTTPTSQILPKSTSQLSLSSELAQIFSETPTRQVTTPNSNSDSSSIAVAYSGAPQPRQKAKSTLVGTSISTESMANDVLRTIANTSMIGSKVKADKSFTEVKKTLPKLKHKSGFPVEKQKPQSAHTSSPPSSFNAKPKKVNPQNIIVKPLHFSPTSTSQRILSPQNATITPSSVFQSPSSPYNPGPGTIEITKLKKKTGTLPALGSGITVTEVRDKSAINTANAGNSGMFGGSNNNSAKGTSFNNQRSPITVTPHSSNFASVISSTTPSSSSSTPKITHSVTISPSPLQNLTSDLSDRFNIGNFLLNKQNNKLPGFITSYDVSALLSSSNLPDIPTSKTSSDISQVSTTNPNLNRN